MKSLTLVVSKDEGAEASLEEAVAQRFCESGLRVLLIPHLYHVPEDSPLWEELKRQVTGQIVLFSWMHPRPAEWVMRKHGMGGEGITALNLNRFESAEECLAAMEELLRAKGEDPHPALSRSTGRGYADGEIVRFEEATSQRWYPVVDGARCINCHHCLQFCLFGVYELDEAGKLVARNPDRCKAGCPACSRICPQGAIMFPLYQKDRAIAGAPGTLMSPDPAARRMFYMRTKRPCPVCGRTEHGQNPANVAADQLCQECGGVRETQTLTLPGRGQSPNPLPSPGVPGEGTQKGEGTEKPAFDDLDALVDQLDDVMRRRG